MNQALSINDAIKKSSALFNQGKYQESETICRSILTASPKNADANHILGLIAIRCKNYKDAIKFIKNAIKANTDNAQFHDSIGNAYTLNNNTEDAIKSFKKSLSLNGAVANTHYNLANIYLQKNNLIEAKKYLKAAIKLKPEHIQAIYNLSLIYSQEGEYEKAEALLLKLANSSPTDIRILYNLANNYSKAGKYQKALDTYQKAIAIKPDFFEAYFSIGNLYRLLNDSDKAIKNYQLTLRLKPDLVEAKNNMAIVYMENKDYDNAIMHFTEAIKINPLYTFTFLNFANLYKKIGATTQAEALYKKAIELDPNFTEAYYNLASLYSDTAQIDKAITHFKKAISLNSRHAPAYKDLGMVYKQMGKFDLAIQMLESAISFDPTFAEAYRELSSVKKLGKDDAELTAMLKMLSHERLTDEERMHLSFGLARVYEGLNEYDNAFKHLATANISRRKLFPYNKKATQTFFSKIKALFSSEFIERRKDFGSADKTPIFILGMPRSGSSLIEQILATHSKVFGAGELNYIEESLNLISSTSTDLKYPDNLSNIDEHTLLQLAESYLKRVREHSPDAEYVIDKMPQNFIYIGLIKLIFPKAKIIHSTRDEMDTCLSIYKHGFYEGHAYADNLKDLGEYYNLYRDLMNHWNNIFPESIHEVNYENLVANQEEESRRLLNFCGLSWEEECLSFYKTKRRVHTASSTQVKKAIYKDSVKLWKNFDAHLQPLKQALNYNDE